MKKFYLLLNVFLLSVVYAYAGSSQYNVEIDGIYYNLYGPIDPTAEVVASPNKYSGDIVIPEVVNGVYKVKGISGAFSGCTELTSVSIPNSVTFISDNSFEDCIKLSSIDIPQSVVTIGANAFSGCCGLTSFFLPKSVTTFGNLVSGALTGCSNLSSIEVEEGNPVYDSRNNCNAIIETEENKIKNGCKNTIIPQTVTAIDLLAFYGCVGLNSITIPKSVTNVGPIAFANCPNLKSIIIEDGNSKYDSRDNCNAIIETSSNAIIVGCKNTIIPNSVTSIGYEAFEGCSGLTDVYCMGEKAPSASDAFFQNDIKGATLHVKDYAIESFKGVKPWTWFKEIVCDEKVTDFNLTYYVDGEVYKTETHKYDDEIIPEIIKKKGMTFSGWDIEIPEKMPGKDVDVKGTFSWSKSTIDNVIYEVSDTINNYCKAIGNESASGAIKIAEAVDFDFSYNVTTITGNTFNGCKDITSIEIPATVTTIGERAFANIDKLTDVTIYAEDIPETDRTAFENSYIEDYVTLHVPAASIDKYKEVAPWKNFKSIITIEGTEPPQTFKLIYMVDGEVYKTVEIEEGAAITPEPAPTKEGYEFSGWSTIPATMPAEDVTITGTFTKNKPKEEEVDTGEDVIKITSAGQTTWCSKHDLDFTDIEGLKAYIAPGYDRESGTIWLMRVFKVPAGEGILLMGDPNEYRVPHKPTTTYYTNMFVGTTEPKTIYESENGYTNYYLSSGTSGVGFYRVTDADGVQLKANRAYLPLKTSTQASTRGFIGMEFGEDGTTGMRNLTPALSKGEGVYYNLQGQRVDMPSKGLYIVNGKKVVIRSTTK